MRIKMKKFGFTLAEILVTLGIIGVVAALVAPPILQNAYNAHVGPHLQKIVSTIENANRMMMNERGVNDLWLIANNPRDYFTQLSRYINDCTFTSYQSYKDEWTPSVKEYQTGTTKSGENRQNRLKGSFRFYFPDNTVLIIVQRAQAGNDHHVEFSEQPFVWNADNNPGPYIGPYTQFEVDIDGPKAGPNTFGKDIFFFTMDRNGKVMPHGSQLFAQLMGHPENTWDQEHSEYYDNMAPQTCIKGNVQGGWGCTGSIFENNLKIIYQ